MGHDPESKTCLSNCQTLEKEGGFGDILETLELPGCNQYYTNELMVEAAGIEPVTNEKPNRLMACGLRD